MTKTTAPLTRAHVPAPARGRPALLLAAAVIGLATAAGSAQDDQAQPGPTEPRDWLEQRGISLEASFIADGSRNLRGGRSTSTGAYRHLFNASVIFDTEPLFDLEGGTFFVNFQTFHGRDGTAELVGDFQVFSNIDASPFTQVAEVWYEQWLAEKSLRLKLGKVDANSEFAYVENGGEFLNSSPGFSPTIVGFPSYPDPATSVNLFAYPEPAYVGVGIYDGATADDDIGRTGNRGPSTFLGRPSDLFLIVEAGLEWGRSNPASATEGASDVLPGRLGIGAYRHTGTFDRFTGGRENGADGAYLVLDQTIYQPNHNRAQSLGLFAQYGYAEPALSPVDHHLGLGAQWTGAVPGRPEDVTGLMGSYVHFSDRAGFAEEHELAIEAFHKLQLTEWASLKPDVQYIVHPGGDGTPDALVATLRCEFTF